jgi:hypothetical protein
MHVAATNIILWIRTLVKETLEEIMEVEEEHLHKIERQQEYDLEHGHETVNIIGKTYLQNGPHSTF